MRTVEPIRVGVLRPRGKTSHSGGRWPRATAPRSTTDQLSTRPPPISDELNLTPRSRRPRQLDPEVELVYVVVDFDQIVFRTHRRQPNLAIDQLVLNLGDFRMTDGGAWTVRAASGGEPISASPGSGASEPASGRLPQFEAWIEPASRTDNDYTGTDDQPGARSDQPPEAQRARRSRRPPEQSRVQAIGRDPAPERAVAATTSVRRPPPRRPNSGAAAGSHIAPAKPTR